LAGFGLDAGAWVVDDIVVATLRGDECGEGETEGNPGAHVKLSGEI
jgi:hypothetical protein